MAEERPPKQILDDIGLVVLPSHSSLEEIYRRAAELASIRRRIEEVETVLRELKDDARHLENTTLPKLFDQVHTDRLGIPGWNADIVLKIDVHANIKTDAPEEERRAGFAEIERLGGEDIVRHTVSVDFPMGEWQLAADLLKHLRGLNWLGGRTVSVKKGVPWNTLTKFVKEMVDQRVPVNLEVLGGYMRRSCQVVWRKTDR